VAGSPDFDEHPSDFVQRTNGAPLEGHLSRRFIDQSVMTASVSPQLIPFLLSLFADAFFIGIARHFSALAVE
jgi:hypothetical protein